jgi:hypothetical protein
MEQRFLLSSIEKKRQVVEDLIGAMSAKKEIIFAFIYGSFNDYTDNLPFRDIDVGVYVSGMGKKDSFYYSLDLSEQLSTLTQLPVDVRILNFAPISFLFHVIRGELIIDKDEDSRCSFMERVVRHYLDMKPLLRRSIKEAFAS